MTALLTAEWPADQSGLSGIEAKINLATLPLGRILAGTTTSQDDNDKLIYRSFVIARHNLRNLLINRGHRGLLFSAAPLFFRFDNLTSTRLGQTREIQDLLFQIAEDTGQPLPLFFGLPEILFGVRVIIESTDPQSSTPSYYR